MLCFSVGDESSCCIVLNDLEILLIVPKAF